MSTLYLSKAIRKLKKQTCKVNEFAEDDVLRCFNHLIETDKAELLIYMNNGEDFGVGLRARALGHSFCDLAFHNISTDYEADLIEWDKLATGLEYIYVGMRIINEVRPTLLRNNVRSCNNSLCLAATGLLMGRNDMTSYYFPTPQGIGNLDGANFDLYEFLNHIINNGELMNTNVFKLDQADIIADKMTNLLEGHQSKSKHTARDYPFYSRPFNVLPVHILLWLKNNNYEDDFGLYKALSKLEKAKFQKEGLLSSLEAKYLA